MSEVITVGLNPAKNVLQAQRGHLLPRRSFLT